MSLSELLQFSILNIDKYNITVSDLVFAILVIFVARLFLFFIRKLFRGQTKAGKIEIGKSHSLYQIVKYFIWIIAITSILKIFGIDVTLIIAGSAALFVGLGFGLQHIFNDWISGILILFEGTIKVDEIVELEEGMIGKITHIGLRTSELTTRDNITVIVPNSKFINNQVVNWSRKEQVTRFHVQVGVAYGSDVNKVKEVLLECAKGHNEVLNNPSPFVRIKDFGNSSIDFQLFFWSLNSFYIENIKSELRFKIDELFRQNKITIPFPQRDVHIKTDEST